MAHELDGATATIHTAVGEMTFEFFPDKAPGHVANFFKLADDGFYNGTVFHRVIPGFMIQGGCPKGDGTGGPGHRVDAEFNDMHHARGVMSMARSADPNSAGSQFFVMHGDSSHLDGQYTAFGRLIAGEDTLDAIASGACQPGGEGSKPIDPIKVEKVTTKRA